MNRETMSTVISMTLAAGLACLPVQGEMPQDPAATGAAAPAPAVPAVGDAVVVALSSGDAIRAKLLAEDAESITIEHPVLGKVTLKRADVASMTVAAPPPADSGAVDASRVRQDAQPAANAVMDAPRPQAAVNPADNAAAEAAPVPPVKVPSPWKLLFDGNVNYVTAANKQLDFRFAASAVYEVKDVDKWSNNAEYFFKVVDGNTTDNNLLVTSTYDRRLVSNPKVLWFVKGQGQWAPLESYEQRLSAWAGLGYEFLTAPPAKVLGKLGAGYTYEFGTENQGDAQLYAEIQWEWQITANQAIVGSFWITPDFADFSNYLFLARTEWTMKMADIPGLSMLGGVRWQYQSQVDPPTALQNDIRVYAGLRYEI